MIDGIEKEVADMLAKMSPLSPEKHREHVFKTLVCELLTDWKWPKRNQVEIHSFNNARQDAAAKHVKSFLKGNGAIVAMLGERGTGKTTIAAQIAIAEAWKRVESMTTGSTIHRSVFYVKLTDLLTWLKPLYSGFGSTNADAMESLRNYLSNDLTLLVIDEIHECGNVQQRGSILTDILDRRYAAMRDTILISNETTEEFQQSAGGSIVSRLQEHGGIVACNWKSWRSEGSIWSRK